ncbi:MAG: hypothetical protein ACRC39_01735 [Enterobacter sp.]
MSNIYCGNNEYELVNGKILGTPYQCMKKGIGVGLNMPISGEPRRYKPIITSNKYCGNEANLPLGKIMGSVGHCFRKGVGIGRKMQKEKNVVRNASIVDDLVDIPTFEQNETDLLLQNIFVPGLQETRQRRNNENIVGNPDLIEMFNDDLDGAQIKKKFYPNLRNTLNEFFNKYWPIILTILLVSFLWLVKVDSMIIIFSGIAFFGITTLIKQNYDKQWILTPMTL